MHTVRLPDGRWIADLSTHGATYSRHEPHPEILIKVCASPHRQTETMSVSASKMDAVTCDSEQIVKTERLCGAYLIFAIN